MDNKILEEARDTMLTTLEKIGGQSIIVRGRAETVRWSDCH